MHARALMYEITVVTYLRAPSCRETEQQALWLPLRTPAPREAALLPPGRRAWAGILPLPEGGATCCTGLPASPAWSTEGPRKGLMVFKRLNIKGRGWRQSTAAKHEEIHHASACHDCLVTRLACPD